MEIKWRNGIDMQDAKISQVRFTENQVENEGGIHGGGTQWNMKWLLGSFQGLGFKACCGSYGMQKLK